MTDSMLEAINNSFLEAGTEIFNDERPAIVSIPRPYYSHIAHLDGCGAVEGSASVQPSAKISSGKLPMAFEELNYGRVMTE
jgi:hypothetical protein